MYCCRQNFVFRPPHFQQINTRSLRRKYLPHPPILPNQHWRRPRRRGTVGHVSARAGRPARCWPRARPHVIGRAGHRRPAGPGTRPWLASSSTCRLPAPVGEWGSGVGGALALCRRGLGADRAGRGRLIRASCWPSSDPYRSYVPGHSVTVTTTSDTQGWGQDRHGRGGRLSCGFVFEAPGPAAAGQVASAPGSAAQRARAAGCCGRPSRTAGARGERGNQWPDAAAPPLPQARRFHLPLVPPHLPFCRQVRYSSSSSSQRLSLSLVPWCAFAYCLLLPTICCCVPRGTSTLLELFPFDFPLSFDCRCN